LNKEKKGFHGKKINYRLNAGLVNSIQQVKGKKEERKKERKKEITH